MERRGALSPRTPPPGKTCGGRRPRTTPPGNVQAYVYPRTGRERGAGSVPLRVVAAAAGVSETAAAAALGGKGRVGDDVRRAVERAAANTGYERRAAPDGPAWHWRRSAFEEM